MSQHDPSHQLRAGEPQYHSPVEQHGTIHASTSPFTDGELHQFHMEDYAAGKAVVLLMIGIFGIGVLIYSIVAASVMR